MVNVFAVNVAKDHVYLHVVEGNVIFVVNVFTLFLVLVDMNFHQKGKPTEKLLGELITPLITLLIVKGILQERYLIGGNAGAFVG